VRILHTSDWHLGKTLENINRLDEQKQFIDELCLIADKEEIDLVLVAGDIFDTYTPSAAAEELFFDAVNRLNDKGRRAIIVIAGNHDSPERLCASSSLAFRNGIILLGYPSSYPEMRKTDEGNISVVNSGPGWLELSIKGCNHNVVIIALPYPSEARLDQLLSEELDESKIQKAYSDRVESILEVLSKKFRNDTVNLVVSHIFVRGGWTSDSERTIQVGGAMTVDPKVLPTEARNSIKTITGRKRFSINIFTTLTLFKWQKREVISPHCQILLLPYYLFDRDHISMASVMVACASAIALSMS
jgi:exonuclease SbcD